MRREEHTHRAFRGLLEAIARPGQWMPTPATDAQGALELLRLAVWEDDPAVVVTDSSHAAAVMESADPGTEDEPEASTTVVVLVTREPQTAVSLDGPGIRERVDTRLPLDHSALAAREERCSRFPCGVDTVLIDEAGRVLGLPRTTVVKEL